MRAEKVHDVNIEQQVLTYVNSEVAAEVVELDTDLLLTGAVDSLGVMRVTQWMEDEHGVDVDPLDVTLTNFQTVQRMSNFLESKLQT